MKRSDKIKYKHYIKYAPDSFAMQSRQLEVKKILEAKGIKYTDLMNYLEGRE